jgi:hypothetical protein
VDPGVAVDAEQEVEGLADPIGGFVAPVAVELEDDGAWLVPLQGPEVALGAKRHAGRQAVEACEPFPALRAALRILEREQGKKIDARLKIDVAKGVMMQIIRDLPDGM